MWHKFHWAKNQGFSKAVFLLETQAENIFLFLFQLLETIHISWHLLPFLYFPRQLCHTSLIPNVSLIALLSCLPVSLLRPLWGFPGGSDGKESACSAGDMVRSLGQEGPWRREWQPSPVVLPGECHGQSSLAGYSSWGHKESDMTGRLSLTHTHTRPLWHHWA